jgi:ribosomal protein S18 acetylase RimI-like enzyme
MEDYILALRELTFQDLTASYRDQVGLYGKSPSVNSLADVISRWEKHPDDMYGLGLFAPSGVLAATMVTSLHDDLVNIRHLHLCSEVRGCTALERLVSELCDQVERKGFTRVCVVLRPIQLDTQEAFRAVGFKLEKRLHMYFGDDNGYLFLKQMEAVA